MKQKRLIIFFFICVFYPVVSLAISVEEITRPLREKYKNANTFIILYKQRIEVKGLDKVDEFKGRIVFSKPDHFRWEGVDNKGRKQIIIIVKRDMLMYIEETDTLTKRKLFGSFEKQLKNRYIPWLSVENNMRTKYVDTEVDRGKKTYKLEILPESGDEYKNMFFWVDTEKQDVLKIEVIDTAGNHMTLFFDSTIFTQKVPKEEFIFTPEPQTQIMEINEE